MLGLQSPLHLFGDGLWQPEFLHGLFQGLQVALRPRLLSLEPLTLLVQAVLPGFLQSLVISCGLGHGSLLRFVAVPRSWHGGDHDPFFMGYQALSHGLDDSAASVAASDKKRTSQESSAPEPCGDGALCGSPASSPKTCQTLPRWRAPLCWRDLNILQFSSPSTPDA